MSIEASKKLPEMMLAHFQTVAMLADFFANLLQGILFKEYRDIMFNSVSQYPKDHQDPRSVLKNLEIKAFKVFMAKSGDKVEVTYRQSVDSKKIPCHWNPMGSQSVRLVGLEWDCTKCIQRESLYRNKLTILF